MITLDDFIVLPFNKKCDFITVFADYLMYRVEDDKKNYLYHMKDFFVEVCYAPAKGEVLEIRAFYETDHLDAYYAQIDISDLAYSY